MAPRELKVKLEKLGNAFGARVIHHSAHGWNGDSCNDTDNSQCDHQLKEGKTMRKCRCFHILCHIHVCVFLILQTLFLHRYSILNVRWFRLPSDERSLSVSEWAQMALFGTF